MVIEDQDLIRPVCHRQQPFFCSRRPLQGLIMSGVVILSLFRKTVRP
jgi:hypothetical protein